MNLVHIHRCLADETRLRILNLLQKGELCVCHLQDILDLPQVKVSKHLGFLRQHGLVSSRRDRQWTFYSLPLRPPREVRATLECLWHCADTETQLRRDRRKLQRAILRINTPAKRNGAPKRGRPRTQHANGCS